MFKTDETAQVFMGVYMTGILPIKKYNTAVDTAIDQIHRKNYPAKVLDYTDNLLLVGISYDKGINQHTCRIEKV